MAKGLLGKVASIRMLKLIVWQCIIYLDLFYITCLVLAVTVVPAADSADLIGRLATLCAGTHGGELLITAVIRLHGKADEPQKPAQTNKHIA